MPIITARELTKVYGRGATEVRALDDVDFDVAPGEFVAIMGPSGSGKSTLLHVIGALEPATSGTVALEDERYDGLDDDELTRLRRERMGFVFQFFNLLPSLSALENVLLPALIARRATTDMRDRAQELLRRVGLADRAEHTPAELSGGEQQRVSIARALRSCATAGSARSWRAGPPSVSSRRSGASRRRPGAGASRWSAAPPRVSGSDVCWRRSTGSRSASCAPGGCVPR